MGFLWLFRARPWAKGWAEVCEWSDQLPIIKLSLTAAYLWFPLTKGKACVPLPIQHRHGFVSVSFIIKH